jgi:F0F1-type ATP synthase assembly protein I
MEKIAEQIAPMLQQLAAQLGTTSEYLWKVLVRQGPISAITNLIQYGIIILVAIFWWHMTKWFISKVDGGWDEATYWIPVIGWVVLAILFAAMFFALNTVINGLFHPEYWALNKVLALISSK